MCYKWYITATRMCLSLFKYIRLYDLSIVHKTMTNRRCDFHKWHITWTAQIGCQWFMTALFTQFHSLFEYYKKQKIIQRYFLDQFDQPNIWFHFFCVIACIWFISENGYKMYLVGDKSSQYSHIYICVGIKKKKQITKFCVMDDFFCLAPMLCCVFCSVIFNAHNYLHTHRNTETEHTDAVKYSQW